MDVERHGVVGERHDRLSLTTLSETMKEVKNCCADLGGAFGRGYNSQSKTASPHTEGI